MEIIRQRSDFIATARPIFSFLKQIPVRKTPAACHASPLPVARHPVIRPNTQTRAGPRAACGVLEFTTRVAPNPYMALIYGCIEKVASEPTKQSTAVCGRAAPLLV